MSGSTHSEHRPDFPARWERLTKAELKRLKITWEAPQYGRLGYIDLDGTRNSRWQNAQADVRDLADIEIHGRLTIVSEDGKTEAAVRACYPLRVLMAKHPSTAPNWTQGHSDQDTTWDDTVTEADGRFVAVIYPRDLLRQPGAAEKFQTGFCFGFGEGRTLTWSGDSPLVTKSLTQFSIIGPRILSATLQAINASPSPKSGKFNPVALVQAVNALQTLGKERAIAELRHFLEISSRDGFSKRVASDIDTSDSESVFLIVRLLFEPASSNEKLPAVGLGGPGVIDSPSPEHLPLFPLAVCKGYPFILVDGYILGGLPEPASAHVDWAEKHGKLREGPMIPEGDPLAAADALAKKLSWKPNGSGAEELKEQARMAAKTMGGARED